MFSVRKERAQVIQVPWLTSVKILVANTKVKRSPSISTPTTCKKTASSRLKIGGRSSSAGSLSSGIGSSHLRARVGSRARSYSDNNKRCFSPIDPRI